MNIEIIKAEKHDVELTIDNLTVAEIVRVYLYKQGIDFAAWRREHPSKPLVMKIQSSDKTVKKAIADAVAAITKECNNLLTTVKK